MAALLHDLGHWPFCHAIEDLQLPSVPKHETFAKGFLLDGEMAGILSDEWNIEPSQILALLSETPRDRRSKILASMLSGPIDIDKMDYLFRDSLHAGVPYGRHFDQHRLIGSLCLNQEADGLAITDKGKTAAELMVFARYVMFSEVYWHHAVRAATAMLQRAFYALHEMVDLERLLRLDETRLIAALIEAAKDGPVAPLLQGLFGSTRRLYKRVGQFSFFEHQETYRQLARRPYPWLVRCAENFAELAGARLGRTVEPYEVLFDAPPVELEVEFDVEIHFPKEDRYRRLEEVSPVVKTLARQQFDDYVKRVRIFGAEGIARELSEVDDLQSLVAAAIERTES